MHLRASELLPDASLDHATQRIAGERVVVEVEARERRILVGDVLHGQRQRRIQRFDVERVAKIGGDEFVCLSVDASPAEIAANLARLQQNIAKSNLCASRAYSLSLSIGAATFDPANPIDLETLLAEADKQMYIAKKSKIRNTG